MLVFHFSKFILFMAHFSDRGLQKAPWTTAVAPTPRIQIYNNKFVFFHQNRLNIILLGKKHRLSGSEI